MNKVKIIKHTYCKRNPCPHIGLIGEIEERIDKDTFWVRLENGKLAKCDKGDFEKQLE